MSRLEKDLSNSYKVLRIDVNSNVGKHIWNEYNIRYVPTFLLMDKQKAVWRTEGNVPRANKIKNIIAKLK